MSKLIGPLTSNILNSVIHEFKKKENKQRISSYIIKPIFEEIISQCYPYIFIYTLILMIIIILLIFIIYKLRSDK